jgi:hypothetical protein
VQAAKRADANTRHHVMRLHTSSQVNTGGYEPGLYVPQTEIPLPELPYGSPASCFLIFERDTSQAITPSTFTCELKFNVVEVSVSPVAFWHLLVNAPSPAVLLVALISN